MTEKLRQNEVVIGPGDSPEAINAETKDALVGLSEDVEKKLNPDLFLIKQTLDKVSFDSLPAGLDKKSDAKMRSELAVMLADSNVRDSLVRFMNGNLMIAGLDDDKNLNVDINQALDLNKMPPDLLKFVYKMNYLAFRQEAMRAAKLDRSNAADKAQFDKAVVDSKLPFPQMVIRQSRNRLNFNFA